MHKSQRLRISDVRAVFESVQRVLAAGSDPDAWRPAAIRELMTLLHAEVGLSADMLDALPGACPRPVRPLDVGWSAESVRQRYGQYLTSGEVREDPGMSALLAGHASVRFMTRFRRQMVDDRTWYAAPSVSEARRSGEIDDFVSTTVSLRPGVLHGFVLYRGWNDRPFDHRDARVARLFHLEILKRIRAGARAPIADLPDGPRLAPRLKQTLELLLAGSSVKEVASALRLRTHTINGYVKALYQRLGVNTRAELLSKYVPRITPPNTLRLLPEMLHS